MRRFSTLLVLCAWLLASGAHWDVVQGFAWGRMIANYSKSMPLAEAVRLTFTADNLCQVCTFVADNHTRSDASGTDASQPARAPLFKAGAPLACPPEYHFVFSSVPAPKWPTAHFRPDALARPAPPVEPPRAA